MIVGRVHCRLKKSLAVFGELPNELVASATMLKKSQLTPRSSNMSCRGFGVDCC
jgi:hypothetical protein